MESPRDVYASACARIAEHFVEQGFRFAKSGPHLTKKAGDFSDKIRFDTSHYNCAGRLVQLRVVAIVTSKKLARWREAYPQIDATDVAAGGMLENLTEADVKCDWNLANPRTRDAMIDKIVSTIESIALPYFDRFEDLPTLTDQIAGFDAGALEMNRPVEFLMCFADEQFAKKVVINFLKSDPRFIRPYRRDFERYAERGLDWRSPSGYAMYYAFVSNLFGFGDLSKEIEEP